MNKLLYKLDTFLSRVKFKYYNSFLHKILKSNIVFYLFLLIFLISFWTYLYIIITNSTHWFQRMFNHYIFKIDNIKEKILFLSIFSSLYFVLYYQKKLKKIFNKFIFNIFSFNYLLYLGILYLFVKELKNQVLLALIPLVLYFIYKMYLYIENTKDDYKFKFIFDSRYFFLVALILLFYTPIYIYFNDQKIAEQLSIYAYYALVIWVIYEIIISKFQKKKK